jgi:hypothetical protein
MSMETIFAPREKRQRKDPLLLETYQVVRADGKFVELPNAYHKADIVLGTAKVLGVFVGKNAFNQPQQYEHLAITLADGTIIPAYRRGPGYELYQNFEFKVVRPS